MNAKQQSGQASLFLRVPTKVKQHFERAAEANGRSLNAELNETLAEKSNERPFDKYELTRLNLQVQHLQGDLRFWEQALFATTNQDADLHLAALRSEFRRRQTERAQALERAAEAHERNRQEVERESEWLSVEQPAFRGLGVPMPTWVQEAVAGLPVVEKRRLNLMAQLEARPRGTRSALADALGWGRPRISHLLAPNTSKAFRPMSADIARRIEESLKLPKGSLDRLDLSVREVHLRSVALELQRVLVNIRRQLLGNTSDTCLAK